MSIKDIKTVRLEEYPLTTLQSNLSEFTKQLTRVPFLDGNLIQDVSVSTTAKEVPHGLGREPIGYFVVKADSSVNVFDTTSTTPKVTIKLTASASATVSLWVF